MKSENEVLDPVPGEPVDPPYKSKVEHFEKVEQRSLVAGVLFRTVIRFGLTKASLLAAGTTYYVFLSIFALVALAYGVVSMLGADDVSAALTRSLNEAFPGLIGEEGIDPGQLKSIGQAAGIVGLVGMLYAGTGAMGSVSMSIHQIFAAPKDPRNIVLKKLRLIGWVLIVAPLMLLSFAFSGIVSTFARPVLELIGMEGTAGRVVLQTSSLGLALAVDFLLVFLLLSHLGGVRPDRKARIVGAAAGAVGIELLKQLMGTIVSFTVAKPQYGAFAMPIAVMLVLYLQSMVLYFSAALTAGVALQPDDAGADPDDADCDSDDTDRAETDQASPAG